MSLLVRAVERADVDALGALHLAAWRAAYRGLMADEFLDGLDLETFVARWRSRLGGDELPPVRVAVQRGDLVGCCSLAAPTRDADANGTVAEVAALNVLPSAWGRGVGSALLCDVLGALSGQGWQAVSLWVVDGNDRAISLSRRFGFDFDGASKLHEPSGAREVRMRRSLSDR